MSRAEQMAKMKADKEAKEKANKRRDRTQIIFEVKFDQRSYIIRGQISQL